MRLIENTFGLQMVSMLLLCFWSQTRIMLESHDLGGSDPKHFACPYDFAFCSSDKQIIMFEWLQFPWSPAQTSTSCANCSLNTFVFLIEQKLNVQTMSMPLVILIPKQEQCSNGLIFCFLIQIDMFIWMLIVCASERKKSVCSDNFCCVVHLIQRYTTAS